MRVPLIAPRSLLLGTKERRRGGRSLRCRFRHAKATARSDNVWDVNEHVQALIRSRQPIETHALSDLDTPLESLAAQSASATEAST
jgi:hypothetical protein